MPAPLPWIIFGFSMASKLRSSVSTIRKNGQRPKRGSTFVSRLGAVAVMAIFIFVPFSTLQKIAGDLAIFHPLSPATFPSYRYYVDTRHKQERSSPLAFDFEVLDLFADTVQRVFEIFSLVFQGVKLLLDVHRRSRRLAIRGRRIGDRTKSWHAHRGSAANLSTPLHKTGCANLDHRLFRVLHHEKPRNPTEFICPGTELPAQ